MDGQLKDTSRIYVSGHRGLVGSAVLQRLQRGGFAHLLTATRNQLDLRDQRAVDAWFAENRPEYVVHVAGTVGGIQANATRPAEFLYDNLMIHATVLRAAWQHQVMKLLYLGSSCIYPRDAPQPLKEDYLLQGPLEPTNEAYAIAKIAGLVSCQAYRRQHGCHFVSAMPTNLYGPHDRFDLVDSHVVPALIRKFHDCRMAGGHEVTIWGSGTPRRELMHVDDLADACLFLLAHYDEPQTINVGTGQDVSIRELAECIRRIVYPDAKIVFDTSMPDGTPRKLLDVSRIHALGWRHQTQLSAGITSTYEWFLQHEADSGRAHSA